MIRKFLAACSVAVAIVGFGTAVVAADTVDNPRYLDWSKYKPGTSLKMEVGTAASGQNIKSAMTTTLKEVTAEKVVLEMKIMMEMPGMAMPPQVHTMVEPAKIEKAKIKPTNPELMPNCKIINKGTEDVTVAGKTYKCKWFEMEMDMQGQKMRTKSWTCDDVLDHLVKSETKMPTGSSTMTLTEFNPVK